MPDSPIELRAPRPEDAVAIADLCAQLGYRVNADEIRDRLAAPSPEDSSVVVARLDGRVVGWLEVGLVRALESGTWAEITGLVVDAATRRRGVGDALVRWAADWARGRGQPRLRVRTNVIRKDAFAFYTRLGFGETKQQRVLDLPIDACPGEGGS
jgi:GNAT superfamily N-acetyltransferase